MAAPDVVSEWLAMAKADLSSPDRLLFQFVCSWIAFNALYSFETGKTGHPEEEDASQIRRFTSTPRFSQVHTKALGERNGLYARAIAVIRDHDNAKVKGRLLTLEEAEELDHVVRRVYRIRCNLFHGLKSPADIWDRKLVTAAWTIVTRWVELLDPSVAEAV